MIADSLSSFAAERPDIPWSTFALYACPWAGWIVSCFDTEEKSAQIVARFGKSGPAWYGQDQWGRFNNNCADFQFFEWRSLELAHWHIEYEEANPIHVRDLGGVDLFIWDENEAINGLVFKFLRTVMLDELRTIKTNDRSLVQFRRRFGIQLLDSTFVEFWRDEDISG